MSQSPIPHIETARLLLRPFARTDLEDYAHHIFADAEVMRYLPKRALTPRERAERTMTFFNEQWVQRGYSAWAVADKITGRLMGHCGLSYLAEIDEVEVLYALAKPYWGQGFATEAARTSVQFGFEQVNLARLIALAVPENVASRRVMEHLGFVYEKDTHHFGLDLVQYALQRERYQVDGSFFLLW
jgi:ribosomal-protein-alanine N-acetyltransferase